MNSRLLRTIRPLLLVFVAFSVLFVSARAMLERRGFDQDVLIVGNLIIAIATITSLLILLKGGKAGNPRRFVSSMYGSFMIRFFIIIIAAFVYIMIEKKNVNKPALIACAVMYMIYSFLEISILMKTLKQQQSNA